VIACLSLSTAPGCPRAGKPTAHIPGPARPGEGRAPLRIRLENGLTVLLYESHAAPVVAFQAWVGVGSADEAAEEAGIAHVFEHMLFKGTDRRGVGQIAQEIEAAGGEINAWTSFDQTVYHLVLASRYFDTGLDILADAVQHSSFDPGELERELKVVLEEIKQGARILKLFVTGGHGNVHAGTNEFSREELAAVVETAHARGVLVRAHCAWKREMLECIELGVDVIDHGDEIDAEVIDAMAEAGTFFDPSILYLEKLLAFEPLQHAPGFAPARDATQRELENLQRWLPEAQAAGVRIVLGDDYGAVFLPHGTYAEEIEFYVKRMGLAPLDVLRWATRNGAALMGREHELGAVEAGKLADLLVVDGDPSVDVSVLGDEARLLGILKGGAFVKDALGA